VGTAESSDSDVEPGARRDRRHRRHEATRRELLDAAWKMVRADGLGALSLSALARAAGMEPQSLYNYFASKHAIYDAMFADANAELLAHLDQYPPGADPIKALHWRSQSFAEFCVEDPARFQLLFQRSIPGFEPSEASYALARQVLETARQDLARADLAGNAHLEVYTSLIAGLVSQQLANDPGGRRYLRHLDEVIDMYLDHVKETRRTTTR
jgi:AcrR family transcriptional regulator